MSHDITYFMIFMNSSSHTTFRKLNVTVKPVKKSTFGFGSFILLPLEVSSWKECGLPFHEEVPVGEEVHWRGT